MSPLTARLYSARSVITSFGWNCRSHERAHPSSRRLQESAAQGVLDHFAILRRAEQDADGRGLVGLADVAVQGLQIELQLAQVLRLELVHLELERDQAVQAAMKKEQVEEEIPAHVCPSAPG